MVARVLAAVLLVAACSDSTGPGGRVAAPKELEANAVSMSAVRVSWRAAENADVTSYELERRTNLRGDFETIQTNVQPDGGDRVTYFDTDVEPNTYYGYRVRAVSRFGARSRVSNVGGTKTAPVPGVLIRTSTAYPNPASADPDGYTALIRGATDTISVTVGVNGERVVSPMPRGDYSIVLRGLAVNCGSVVEGDTVRSVTITDEGLQTVAGATFILGCRDPSRASLVIVHQTAGDTLDADGVALTITGVTPTDPQPYYDSRRLDGRNGAFRIDNLRPGDYEIAVADVDAPCELQGAAKRELAPLPLAIDTVAFTLTCRKPIVEDTTGGPFVWRNTWSSATARPGDKVSLLSSLDLSATPAQEVSGAAATIEFDNTVIRYDSARSVGSFDITTVNRPQPTVLAIAAFNTSGQGASGNIQLVRTWFTVIGVAGSSVRTSTTLGDILDLQPNRINDRVRVSDATLGITNAGPVNQPPSAQIAAPATATTGASVSFNGAQSTDVDGTIASYAWTFGDNTTGTGASVSHAYASAGTYTARLTVTDNGGATNARDHTIVVSNATTTTGAIFGSVTSPQLGVLVGVTVTVDGRPPVNTNGSGAFIITAVPTGTRTITLSNLPSQCTAPAPQQVTVNTGVTSVVSLEIDCPTGPVTYPLTATWSAITNTGPTGRQVTLAFAIDMRAAPGRTDINGNNADPIAGIQFNVAYNGTVLDYTSRLLIEPTGALDLGVVNETGAGTATAQAAVAVASTSGGAATGSVQLMRLTFNIAAGASGSVTPVVTVTEALATTGLVNVTSTVAIVPVAALIIL